MTPLYGYLGAFVAVLCFGSNYVPMKYHDTGDGLTFQWIMCSGILSVGYISLSWAESLVWQWPGLIGGALWACGGALVIPIIRLVGLGVGFLVWSLANLVFAYIWGRFGLFGLDKAVVLNEFFSIGGVMLAVIALLVFFFVDGPEEDNTVEVIEEYNPILPGEDSTDDEGFCGKNGVPLADSGESRGIGGGSQTYGESHGAGSGSQTYAINGHTTNGVGVQKRLGGYNSISSSEAVQVDEYSAIAEDVEEGVVPTWRQHKMVKSIIGLRKLGLGRRLAGLFLAMICGLLYSVSMVPFTVWSNKHPHAGPVDYLFTQYSGIWLMSTILFLVYCILVRPPKFYPKATLASYVCGVGWGIASAGWMVSIKNLGFVVSYPIVAVGPILVTSCWSLLWFREVKGVKNISLFLLSDILVCISIAFVVLSKIKAAEF